MDPACGRGRERGGIFGIEKCSRLSGGRNIYLFIIFAARLSLIIGGDKKTRDFDRIIISM